MPIEPRPELRKPPPYTIEVGKLCAAWSYFELVTDDILWAILSVEPRIGSMISSQKDMQGRWSLILNHAESKLTAPEMDIIRKINKTLATVASDRNIIVHGQIMLQDDTEIACARVTRGAQAGKFHLVTADIVNLAANNIIVLCHAAVVIAHKYGWLTNPPVAEIINDWVKPVEGFP